MTHRRVPKIRAQPDKKPHPSEMRDRRDFVRDLVLAGNTRSEAIRQAVEALYISPQIAERLFRETRDQIRKDFEADHPDARALQAARLQADLAKLREGMPAWRAKRNAEGKIIKGKEKFLKINYTAIARLEAQLADVLGTNEPIRVKVQAEVQVRTSLQAVIANLAPEDKDRLIQEAIEIEKKAGMLPAATVSDRSDTVRASSEGRQEDGKETQGKG